MSEKILKFAVIFNTNAAGGQKIQPINDVISLLKKKHDVKFFKTQSKEAAIKVFEELSTQQFDRLVIAGGDGSVCFAINEILKKSTLSNKLIGYIPAGTANILQIETKIKGKAEEIYEILISEKTKRISLGKFNDKYFFLMAGMGFDSKIIESINVNLKKYLGKIIFSLKGFQHFLFLKNHKMRVEIDNEIIEADWVLCTNSKYYAGSHSITNETNIFDNKVIVYIFKDLTRINLIYYAWLIFIRGDLSFAKNIIKKDLSFLKINGIKNKVLSQIDGENCGYNQDIEIKKTNKYVDLLVP